MSPALQHHCQKQHSVADASHVVRSRAYQLVLVQVPLASMAGGEAPDSLSSLIKEQLLVSG